MISLTYIRNLCLTLASLTSQHYASVQVHVDSNKRLSIPISGDSMNRIAFANDRITQVFGDEEAYTLQSDETRGQVFLKPTEDNGDKPISLTLTTENGLIQDLELVPQKISTKTIILKEEGKKNTSDKPEKTTTPSTFLHPPFQPYMMAQGPENYHLSSPDYASSLIQAIKYAERKSYEHSHAEGEAPEVLTLSDVNIEGISKITYQKWTISLYTVTNTTAHPYEIVENSLGGGGVLAIAVEKNKLAPHESTRLFVVKSL